MNKDVISKIVQHIAGEVRMADSDSELNLQETVRATEKAISVAYATLHAITEIRASLPYEDQNNQSAVRGMRQDVLDLQNKLKSFLVQIKGK